MTLMDVLIIIFAVVVVIGFGLYYLNRWASKKMTAQQDAIAKNKQNMTIFVIDKKHDYAKNVNLPKMVAEQLPKTTKLMKMYFVQAKIGPQILTLICDKHIYNNLTPKKSVQVEMAGLYIVGVKGLKSAEEMKKIEKEKKKSEKQAQKAESKK